MISSNSTHGAPSNHSDRGDLVNFGVAPALVMFAWADQQRGSDAGAKPAAGACCSEMGRCFK